MLRTEIAPSLLQNVRTNIAHGNMGVRLFEVANVFEADPASQTTAKESARLGMVMYVPCTTRRGRMRKSTPDTRTSVGWWNISRRS